jgi:hypothetical protein
MNKILVKYESYNTKLLEERLKFIIENFANFYNIKYNISSTYQNIIEKATSVNFYNKINTNFN